MTAADRRKPAKSPAQRQRELRARRRADEGLFKLRLSRELVRNVLLEEGELAEWDDHDDDRMQDGLRQLLLRTLRDVTP